MTNYNPFSLAGQAIKATGKTAAGVTKGFGYYAAKAGKGVFSATAKAGQAVAHGTGVAAKGVGKGVLAAGGAAAYAAKTHHVRKLNKLDKKQAIYERKQAIASSKASIAQSRRTRFGSHVIKLKLVPRDAKRRDPFAAVKRRQAGEEYRTNLLNLEHQKEIHKSNILSARVAQNEQRKALQESRGANAINRGGPLSDRGYKPNRGINVSKRGPLSDKGRGVSPFKVNLKGRKKGGFFS